MSYSAEISRTQPAAIIFLLDRSASMQEPFGGDQEEGGAARSRATVLADLVNKLIQNLILRCAREDGVWDYFHMGVIGYGERVRRLLRQADVVAAGAGTGIAPLPELVPVSYLADNPLRLDERRLPTRDGGHRITRAPVWIEPEARNGTPMCQALDIATRTVRDWVALHPDSFPPVVINVTDGEATDGDPLPFARRLREYGTDDGETLLFNVHLSESTEPPVQLPDSLAGLPDAYARTLFQMSSVLPFTMRAAAEAEGLSTSLDSRAFIFNADPGALARLLEIGTRPGHMR